MNGPWRKSSRSGSGSGSQCVEARALTSHLQLRDSKLGDASPILDVSSADWRGFVAHVRR